MVLLTVLCSSAARAGEVSHAFVDGIKFYNEKQYALAVAEFKKIANAGIRNGKLFYNIANAYLKDGDIGNAVLWYQRALRYMPEDPDLNFNLQYARSLVKDQPEDRQNPILQILFFWKDMFSRTAIQWIALVSNLLFWGLTALKRIYRSGALKLPAVAALIVMIVFTLTSLYQFYEEKYVKFAVVLPAKVSIRSGLTPDSTELFVLHSGSKVRVDKQQSGHCRIRFSDEKIGWIDADDIGLI